MRAQLEVAAARGSVRARAALEGPPAPPELEYLLGWAIELGEGRRYGMNGPEPISYTDIDAWARLTGRAPAPHEVQALVLLDRARLFPGDAA